MRPFCARIRIPSGVTVQIAGGTAKGKAGNTRRHDAYNKTAEKK
jgi:hypothetical protein